MGQSPKRPSVLIALPRFLVGIAYSTGTTCIRCLHSPQTNV
jgi:hypothetical protein